MTTTDTHTVDEGRLEQLLGQAVTDMGAAMNGVLVMLGSELGLWRGLMGAGPLTAAELAQRAGIPEKYVHQWLATQAGSGYVDYDAARGTFTLSPEQALAFADESSPAYLVGGYHIVSALYRDRPRIVDAMRAGRGFGWHEHDPEMFLGTEQFFRPGYRSNLISAWIPALDGVEEKLRAGATVADIGCGHGVSTILMAQAYPASTIRGFDYHPASVERATALAAAEGAAANASFGVASAKDYPGDGYDLVCFFDCLHDMGDPVGALRHTHEALAPDGTVMLVEPYAGDSLTDNLNPVGRVFYAASTIICTPCSLAQEVGAGLGAQAGERRLREVAEQAGFTRFRRATETPFNLVLEARP
ncbi:MAG TPA: methyltransferase domain-containing protein [Mycobacteriales bacterium]|nr:methyltransferase domain-containing protein [Mycobacteriales bacterium]